MDEQAEAVVLEKVTPTGRGVGTHQSEIEAAYDELQRELYSFALRSSRNSATAEEVVQEAFLRLIREARAGRYPTNARAWLYAVCVNLVRSKARHQQVADRWLAFLRHGEAAEPPEDQVLGHEQADAVAVVVRTLPDDQRTAFLLTLQGFRGPEIARILDKSDGATRVLLFRARCAIRKAVDQGEARP